MPEEPTAPATAAPVAAPIEAPAAAALPTATILTPTTTGAEIVTEVAAAEAPAETPVAAPEAPAEAPPGTEPTIKPHTETASLMEEVGKPVEKKAEEKPADKAAETPVAEAAKYEPFTLPEGVEPDTRRIEAFTEIAAKHNLDQATAQSLVDLHTSTMAQFRDALLQQQHTTFAETRKGWVDKIKADPTLGGSGHETAKMAAARMRDLLVPEAHRAEFAEFMRVTGAGDHPALFRLLHNAARLFDEPAAPSMPARPVPDRGGNGKLPRTQTMYDHPSSRRAAGRG